MTEPYTPRPRFSLLGLIGLTTIIAMGIAVWQLYAEVVPLRQENRRLRDEVGELSIDDEQKLHAIAVRTSEDLTWKWRIWAPEGKKYILRFAGEQIPKQGLPAGTGTLHIGSPGEHWIEDRVRRHRESDTWMDSVNTDFGGFGSSQQDWVEWPSRTSTGDGVGSTTKLFYPDRPVVIARTRISQVSHSSQIEDPSAGFMIWLEPVP